MKTGESASSRGFESHPLRPTFLACALLGALLAATSLSAQQDTARVPLPPISVNALRAGISPAGLPLGSTTLSPAHTLAGAGISLAETLRTVPGLQLDNRHNQALGERLSIRGFGARAGFGIRGVRVLVDGIPATMPDGQSTLNHVDPSHVRGAEVVRGATAAFLGNSAGGAVLLRTGAEPGAVLEASMGAAALRRFSGSFADGNGSGYASWQQQAGFRSYSAWERLLAGGSGAFTVGRGRLELAAHGVHYDARNPGALTQAQFDEDPTQASANNVRQRTGERGTHAQLGAGWLLPLGAYRVELRAHGGVRSLDNPIPPRVIDLSRRFGGLRAQVVRDAGAVTLALGGEAEWQRDDRQNYENLEGARGALLLDQLETVRGAALFAHGRWQPLRTMSVFGAARADRQRFAADDRRTADGDDSGTRTLGAWTGSVGMLLDPLPGIELFANIATAFETPTTTELANSPAGSGGFNRDLQPERTRALEAGVRAGGGSFSGEVVLFHASVRDKLVAYEVDSLPGRQFYRNAGRARHQGLELAAEARPLEPLTLRAAFTRLDARFLEYVVAGADFGGRRIPGAAAHQVEASAALTLAGSRLRVDLRRTGRVAANDANDATAPAYTLLGVRLSTAGVRALGLRAALHGGVDNLLDRKHAAAVSVNAFGGRYYEPGPRRSVYAGLRLTLR